MILGRDSRHRIFPENIRAGHRVIPCEVPFLRSVLRGVYPLEIVLSYSDRRSADQKNLPHVPMRPIPADSSGSQNRARPYPVVSGQILESRDFLYSPSEEYRLDHSPTHLRVIHRFRIIGRRIRASSRMSRVSAYLLPYRKNEEIKKDPQRSWDPRIRTVPPKFLSLRQTTLTIFSFSLWAPPHVIEAEEYELIIVGNARSQIFPLFEQASKGEISAILTRILEISLEDKPCRLAVDVALRIIRCEVHTCLRTRQSFIDEDDRKRKMLPKLFLKE